MKSSRCFSELRGGLLHGQDKKTKLPSSTASLPANWAKLGLTDEQKLKVYEVQADFDAEEGRRRNAALGAETTV